MTRQRIFIAALAALLIALYFLLGLERYFSLDYAVQRRADLLQWRQAAPLVASLAYFGLYVLMALLSLPGAAILTLLGGALFGLGWGVILVSFASTIGATLAFLLSRFLFREGLQARFSKPLAAINRGVEKDGAMYLFTLRLVPLFPFFLINLLMGLTPLGVRRFYWVSQLGMLPGTVVYVNAGTALGSITGTSDLLSPALLFSFALLGVFPWIARALVRWVNGRRE